MTASVIVDGKKLFLNPFMMTLTANLVQAIARSLKSTDGKVIKFHMKDDDLRMFVDAKEVTLSLGQAQRIVRNVLMGLLESLHGAEKGKEFEILYESGNHDLQSK